MIPKTRQEFKEYCLRNIGGGILEINITDEQLEDRIDEALEFFHQYTYDGSIRDFIRLDVTPEMKDQGYVDIPKDIMSIVDIYESTTAIDSGLFSLGYQLKLNAVTSILEVQGGTLDYYMRMTSLADLQYMMKPVNSFRYKETMKRLYLDRGMRDFRNGDQVVIECYRKIQPEDHEGVWNDMFLKKYATALFLYQFGSNLSKFENIQLPSGATYNGQELMSRGKEQLDELQDQVLDKWEEPPIGVMV